MAHRCFISYKTEDVDYKRHIQHSLGADVIDRSLNQAIQSTDEDYILRRIREENLADSSVTIHLIGTYSAESRGTFEQRFIKRELQASLYDSVLSRRNGILGVVLPEIGAAVYRGTYVCPNCGGVHNFVTMDDSIAVREFTYNYYIPNGKCAHTEDERYCVLVSWQEFVNDPSSWVERAYEKRMEPIADKVRVYPP